MCMRDWILRMRFMHYKIHRFFEIKEYKEYLRGDRFCGFPSINDPQKSNDYLRELILSNEHYFVARTGGTECRVLTYEDMVERKTARRMPTQFADDIKVLCGVFNNDAAGLKRLLEIYKESWKSITHYAYWQMDGNKRITQRWLNRDAQLISFHCLKAINYANPYLLSFRNKKVLIVSPFYSSIKKQFSKRELLFPKETLPDFELLTYCPVVSFGDAVVQFKTWEEALNHMYEDIRKIKCDIVVLSCGAYGLPLGAMLYKDGYNVLHIGGMTQCWFGIGGKAYDRDPAIAALMNEHWIRPSKEETLPGANKIEGGNYW